MKYMLDTNICIYMVRHKPPEVIRHFLENGSFDICVSSITYAEMMHGAEKTASKELNRIAVMTFFSAIDVLDFSTKAAAEYGRVRAELELQGTPIDPLDMLIAGHARSEDLVLVTNNTRDFECVKGLKLENWADDK